MEAAALMSLLANHAPAGAVGYCFQLWQDEPFQLVLRKSRITKLGDFSCRPGRAPRITVNADSHPFVFLLTYLHEVAHLKVHRQFGFEVSPHGKEWKHHFRQLCTPLITSSIFPESVAAALHHHLKDPTASSFSDARLMRVLREHDHRMSGTLTLVDLPEGSQFQLHGRWYQKVKLKRTRVLCRALKSRRHYLISARAPVG
jgi:SprT protein